jgi:hypothetical protein
MSLAISSSSCGVALDRLHLLQRNFSVVGDADTSGSKFGFFFDISVVLPSATALS